MTETVLFPSVLVLRAGVLNTADPGRAAGHVVASSTTSMPRRPDPAHRRAVTQLPTTVEPNDEFDEEVDSSGVGRPTTSSRIPGVVAHVFTDPSLPDAYDRPAAELLHQRAEAFFGSVRW